MKGKRLLLCLLVVGALVCSLAASASVYGGREERQRLVEENKGPHQSRGDVGGVFTAALNATQPIYYHYDWNMDFFSLSQSVASSNLYIYGNYWYWYQGGDGGMGTNGSENPSNSGKGTLEPEDSGNSDKPPEPAAGSKEKPYRYGLNGTMAAYSAFLELISNGTAKMMENGSYYFVDTADSDKLYMATWISGSLYDLVVVQ